MLKRFRSRLTEIPVLVGGLLQPAIRSSSCLSPSYTDSVDYIGLQSIQRFLQSVLTSKAHDSLLRSQAAAILVDLLIRQGDVLHLLKLCTILFDQDLSNMDFSAHPAVALLAKYKVSSQLAFPIPRDRIGRNSCHVAISAIGNLPSTSR